MFRYNWDANNILKLGIALAVTNVSIGVTWSLITGSEFNVEAFNTKMTLSGITSKNKQLTKELRQVSQELNQTNLAPQQQKKIKEINLELDETEAEIQKIEDIITDELPKKSKPTLPTTDNVNSSPRTEEESN